MVTAVGGALYFRAVAGQVEVHLAAAVGPVEEVEDLVALVVVAAAAAVRVEAGNFFTVLFS